MTVPKPAPECRAAPRSASGRKTRRMLHLRCGAFFAAAFPRRTCLANLTLCEGSGGQNVTEPRVRCGSLPRHRASNR